jgi:hypothetical protein
MRLVMSEQATLIVRPQSSALSLALSLALGAALGSSVYVVAEIRHRKQIAEHAAHAAPPPAAEPAAAKPAVAEVAKAAPEPAPAPAKEAAKADAVEEAPTDPKAQALAARAAAEQALLDEARTQLEASNAVGALTALDRMKKRFPRGSLAEERELLRVEAYKARGQTVAAKRAARKFAKAYPDNPHLTEIESLLN